MVRALWAGTLALLCAALGPCVCYVPYLASLPLAVYGLVLAVRVPRATLGATALSAHTLALISSTAALAISLMLVLLFAVYFGAIGLAGVAGV